jgi:spermidine synthase
MSSVSGATSQPETWRIRLPRALIALVMFTTGAAGLVFEYVLSTVTTYILGNAIEQFSMTIAVMMLFMGVAGAVQKNISDELLITAFIGAECLLALFGGFGPLLLQAAFAFIPDHFLAIHYSLAAAVGLLIGIEIPLIMRINARWSSSLRANVGSVLTWDYAGAFAGALIWTFVLLRFFPITEIAFILAIANFTIAAAAALILSKLGFMSVNRVSLGFIALTMAALTAGAANVSALNLQLEQRLYTDPIVLSTTTRYQHVVLTHAPDNDDWRLFINGNLQFSSLDEDRYHDLLVHPVMATAAKRERVLILGGGDGLALRRALAWDQIHEVLLVDLDPEIIRLSRDHQALSRLNGGAFADVRVIAKGSPGVSANGLRPARRGPGDNADVPRANVSVIALDADTFLRDADTKSWDIIIIDLPDPSSVELSKLYSLEFYRKVARALAPGGAMAVQSTSPYHAREAFLTIGRTIRAAGFLTLPYRVNVPSFGDWGFHIAWMGTPVEDVKGRFVEGGGVKDATFITPAVASSALAFGRTELESEFSDVNTLMRPVLLERYLRDAWTAN